MTSTLDKIVLGLAACAGGTAAADTVTLQNGDRLSGTVVKMESDTLWLETAYAGTLKLQWGEVARLETDAPVRLKLDDRAEFDTRLETTTKRELSVQPGGVGAPAPLSLDRVVAINPPRDPERTVLSGRASLGGSFARGNTDADTLHLDGELVARNPVQRVTLDGELNEASQNGVDTASNWRVGLKADHFLAERTYVYANTRFDHDGQADLDLRSTLGVGVGRQFVERDDLKFSLEGGLSLVHEDYGVAPDERFPGARAALRYEQGFWNNRLRAFHSSDLLLSLETIEDYLLQTRSGFRVPMGNGLSLGAQVNLDYDAVPATGKDSTDTALLFKLDYTL
ncbi:MAG: YdiY family protein [Gammaproteobacteria bacterium]